MKNTLLRPALCAAAFLASCADGSSTDASSNALLESSAAEIADLGFQGELDPEPHLGGPIPGLSPAERAAFERGAKVFSRRFKPSEGLGPLYNASSCASCHSTPVPGGSAPLYRNFYITVQDFGAIQLPLTGMPSVVVPAFGAGPHLAATFGLEEERTSIPAAISGGTVVTTQRNAIPIFGTGLFEFISDATIMALSDPDDADGDGISGRFNVDMGASATAIGRLGVKSQSNNIEFFTRGPLQNQMGVTSDPFLGSAGVASLCLSAAPQAGASADEPTFDNDGVADPEISRQDLGDLIAFTRFLAPPTPKPFDASATAGEALFASLGCVACHVPELPSSRGPVRAYTDLLLHDMGPGLADGIHMGSPQASTISSSMTRDEFRTQPLWGVSMHAPYLHDGRSETLADAILEHGGEAQASRDAFDALSPADQADLIAFLEHL